jgi:hypothetical protein
MCSTRDGAPPCSGPDRAPIAEEIAAAASAPVEATIRAVKVEAFRPCSAAEMKYASTALTWRGSGSPRHRFMNRSTMVWALSISFCGTAGSPSPRADWATKLSAVTDTRARSSRACSSLMSSNCPSPQYGASMATADCTSTRISPECTGTGNGSAGGRPGPNFPSTSSAQTFPKETCPIRSSISTPRYRSAPPSLSGSAISVSKATTPSSPGLKSDIWSPGFRFSSALCGPRRGGAG